MYNNIGAVIREGW